MDVSSIFKRIAEKSAGGTNAVNLVKEKNSLILVYYFKKNPDFFSESLFKKTSDF